MNNGKKGISWSIYPGKLGTSLQHVQHDERLVLQLQRTSDSFAGGSQTSCPITAFELWVPFWIVVRWHPFASLEATENFVLLWSAVVTSPPNTRKVHNRGAELTRWLDADLTDLTIKNGDLTIKWDILHGRISWTSLKVGSCVVIYHNIIHHTSLSSLAKRIILKVRAVREGHHGVDNDHRQVKTLGNILSVFGTMSPSGLDLATSRNPARIRVLDKVIGSMNGNMYSTYRYL